MSDSSRRRLSSTALHLAVVSLICAAAPLSAQGLPVLSWGSNSDGQLGRGGSVGGFSNLPGPVADLTDVIALSSSQMHSLALKKDGTVWAWGGNTNDQLGNSTSGPSTSPLRVNGFDSLPVIAIAAGAVHCLALTNDGSVWTWGDNSLGQQGNGTFIGTQTIPARVSGLTGVTAIAAGYFHNIALISDGTVRTWGANYAGQLGNGTNNDSAVPVSLTALSGVTAVSAGISGTLVLKGDAVWGWGGAGILLGYSPQSSPVQLPGLTNITAISTSLFFGLALKTDGTVVSFHTGQATTVPGLSNVTAISAGTNHSVALKADGTVWSWGSNDAGQLGDGSAGTFSATPVQALGVSNVTAISAGASHSVAAQSATAAQLINWLMGAVQNPGLHLNGGQTNSLLAKLRAALASAQAANRTTASNQIHSFINQVNDFVTTGVLTPAAGANLIASANAILALI
jgi:alpha-tubulin suppressor-like RCC1 family protein